MKNKFEHFLLSLLLGTSTLLGLSFWLNTTFGFNLFYKEHWDEFARLQASHTPINSGFYISIIVAVLIFLIGIYVIYHPTVHSKKTNNKTIIHEPEPKHAPVSPAPKVTQPDTKEDTPAPIPTNITLARPPRLNLPMNMAQIAAQRQQQNQRETRIKPQPTSMENPYNSTISKIFSDNGYTVKPNPQISGFTPNLFAIGPNEILWIGATDTPIDDLQRAVEKLQSVFQETLEDIQINIKAFIVDTLNQYEPNDTILIFKSIEELKTFVSENPADTMSDEERGNFDAYSEYIDTIIQYIKNI